IYNTNRKYFVDTAGRGRLLDWNNYLLDNYKHSVNTNAIKSLIGNFGINYKVIDGLAIDLKYRIEIQQQRRRLLNDEFSYFTRHEINRFSTINGAGQVSRPIPLGSILDVNEGDINSHNFRGQLNWNKNWGRNEITTILGADLSSRVTDNGTNRYYGYQDDLLLVAPIDYFKSYPLFKGTGSENINNAFSINRFRNRTVAQFVNASYSYASKYVLSASARKD